MLRHILFLTVFLAAVCPGHAAERRSGDPPNVVLILIDDLGWADLGLTGSTFYETPRVTRLAAEGAFFDNAYAASPVCSPTRASILTGKYPSRIGLSNHSGYSGPKGNEYKLVAPAVVGNMPAEDVTLAEALQMAGYRTGHIGKWHLQAHHHTDRSNFPEEHGFDFNVAGHRMGQPGSFYFPYESKQHPSTNVPDLEDGEEGDYLTDILTDKAIQFIETGADKPFFLNLWYYTVHTPIIARKDLLEKYQRKATVMGLEKTRSEAIPEWQSFHHAHQDNPGYAAMVESMDTNVGRIMDTLERLGLSEDTIVVFLSDNGGLSTGVGPQSPTSSLPLRAGKAWVYEGGIRSPMIIRYPRKFKGGQTLSEPAVSTDLYPTIMELAGLPAQPSQHVDGLSLAPLLMGTQERLGRDALYFHYPHYHHICSMGPAGAVRMGKYKLVEVYETGSLELYDLDEDIGEQENLVDAMPELARKMRAMLEVWRVQSGSAMPTLNPDYRNREN